jgi:hypothetical protein
VTLRRVTLCTALAVAVASCTGGDDPEGAPTTTVTAEGTTTTATAPERPTSTTTTAFDPTSVEGAVEAAYLRSWDVYADAVYDLELDEAALAEVYAGDALATLQTEITRRISDVTPSLVKVEHDYEVTFSGAGTASVIDSIVNHQVLIDPATKEAIEEDPAEPQLLNFKMELLEGEWRVTVIQRVSS